MSGTGETRTTWVELILVYAVCLFGLNCSECGDGASGWELVQQDASHDTVRTHDSGGEISRADAGAQGELDAARNLGPDCSALSEDECEIAWESSCREVMAEECEQLEFCTPLMGWVVKSEEDCVREGFIACRPRNSGCIQVSSFARDHVGNCWLIDCEEQLKWETGEEVTRACQPLLSESAPCGP